MSKVTQLNPAAPLTGAELFYLVDANNQDKKATTTQIKDFVLSGTGLDPNYTIEDWDLYKTELQTIVPRDSDNLNATNNPDGSVTLDFKNLDPLDHVFSAPSGQNHPGLSYVTGKISFSGEWDRQDFNPKLIGFNNINGIRTEINPYQTGYEDHYSNDFSIIISQLSYAEIVAMLSGQSGPPNTPLMQLQISSGGNFIAPVKSLMYIDGGPSPISKTVPGYGNFISIIPDIDGFFIDGVGQIPLKNHPNYNPAKPWNALVLLSRNGGDPQPDDEGLITRVKYEIPITNYFNTSNYVRHLPRIPDQDFSIQFPDFDQAKSYYMLLLPEELPAEYELSTLLFNKISQGNMAAVLSYGTSDIQAIVLEVGGNAIFQEGYSTYAPYEIRYQASDKTFYLAEIGAEETISPLYSPSYLGNILSIAIIGFDLNQSNSSPSSPLTIKLPDLSINQVVNGDLPVNVKLGQLYRTTTEGRYADRKIPIGTTIAFYNEFEDFIAIPDIDLSLGLSLDYIQTKQLLINEINKLKQNQIGNYRGTFTNRYAIDITTYKKGDYIFIGANQNEWRVYYAIRNYGESNMGAYYDFSILTTEALSLTTDNIPEGSLNRYFTNERVLGLIEATASPLITLESIAYRMSNNTLNALGIYDTPQNIENTITYDTSAGWKPSVGFLHYRFPMAQSIPKYDGFNGRNRNVIVYDFWLYQASDQGNVFRTGIIFKNSNGASEPRYNSSVLIHMDEYGALLFSLFNSYGNNAGYWNMGFLGNGGHFRLIIDLAAGTIEVLKNRVRILLQSIGTIDGGYLASTFQSTEVIESYFEILSKTEGSMVAYPKRLSVMEKFIN